MTPTRKPHPTYYAHFAPAVDAPEPAAPHRANRKRTRHRPRSRGRRTAGDMSSPPTLSVPAAGPTAMSVRYSYAGPATGSRGGGCASPSAGVGRSRGRAQMPSQAESRVGQACSWGGEREGVFEREMRIFGGDGRDGHGDGDGDGEGTEDLRAPMLEVVLGLFDGLDYDDDAWC